MEIIFGLLEPALLFVEHGPGRSSKADHFISVIKNFEIPETKQAVITRRPGINYYGLTPLGEGKNSDELAGQHPNQIFFCQMRKSQFQMFSVIPGGLL